MKKLVSTIILSLVALVAMAQRSNMGYIFPTGGCRGEEFIVEIGGQNISNTEKVLISGDDVKGEMIPVDLKALQAAKRKGRNKKITAEDNLQIADRIKVRINIGKNAALGIRDIKLVSKSGVISNRLFFEISQLPNFIETEPNNTFEQANSCELMPVVINGQVERGGRDFISFNCKKGDNIVLETKARRLVPYLADAVPGWFQAVLTLYDDKGKEVAYNDDYHLVADPVMVYKAEKSGKYTLAIQDCIFRGREDFVYRVSVGETPFVYSVFPLGGKKGSKVELELYGENLSKDNIKFQFPKNGGDRIETNIKLRKGAESNNFTLENSSDKEIVLSKDLGDNLQSAIELKEGEVVNGRFEHGYDKDWYFFTGKKGEQKILDVKARRLGSIADVKVVIYNSAGKIVAKGDDLLDTEEGMITHHADPQLLFKIPADGRYFARLTENQNFYGKEYSYRLRQLKAKPDFSVKVEPSALSIPQGGVAVFTVFIARKNGFKAPVTLYPVGLPEGFVVSKAEQFGNQSVRMTIKAPADAPMGKLNLQIEGKGQLTKTETITRRAKPVEAMMQAFYITHLIPTNEFRADIVEPLPFSLEIDSGQLPLKLDPAKPAELKVKINRISHFDDPIQLMLRWPYYGIEVAAITVEPNQKEAILKFEILKWKWPNALARLQLQGTLKAITPKGRIVGKPNGGVIAAAIVPSEIFEVQLPSYRDPSLPPLKKRVPANKKVSTKVVKKK